MSAIELSKKIEKGIPPRPTKFDIDKIKWLRQAKYNLKRRLQLLDAGKINFISVIEKTKRVTIRVFEVEAYKQGIILQDEEMK